MSRSIKGFSVALLIAYLMVPSQATATPTLTTRFDTGLGLLVGLGFDPATGTVFVYPDFDPSVYEFASDGSQIPSPIPVAGGEGNDMDLDFAPEPMTIGGVAVPAGSLLVTQGEISPHRLFAVNKDDGTVLAQVDLPVASTVGGSYHEDRNTMFVVEWTTDVIQEIDPATGTVVGSIPVTPTGAPVFDVFYGDVAIGPDGNLFVVSDSQNRIRELTPTGTWIADYNLDPLGISQVAGLDFVPATGDAWIADKFGIVHLVTDLTQGVFAQDVMASEFDGVLSFTVSLGAATPSTVTVDFATANGTASSGSDYQVTTGSLTFAPGETSKVVDVPILSDDLVEADERMFLDLANASGAPITDSRAQGTIVDDDQGNLSPECSDPNAICGSGSNDQIQGTSAAEIIIAGGGSDDVKAGGGSDDVSGGGGNDKLAGGGGNDLLEGGKGKDFLNGGKGRDKCIIEKGEKTKGCERVVTKRHR